MKYWGSLKESGAEVFNSKINRLIFPYTKYKFTIMLIHWQLGLISDAGKLNALQIVFKSAFSNVCQWTNC